jgi:transcriptional regulator with XRE-family HTH domain
MIGARLKARIEATGISQSELARRVGITQGTIAGLISGRSRSSTHLHKIARVLRTTPAYLEGETDDPDEGAPPPSPAPPYQAITLQVLLPGEAALAQMFEGLLMAMDRDLPLDEQARLLAQRLPTGLSQLRDLMPALPKAAAAKPQPSQPTPARAPR